MKNVCFYLFVIFTVVAITIMTVLFSSITFILCVANNAP